MKPEDKRYILENMDKMPAGRIAGHLGLKERKVKKIIKIEKEKKSPATAAAQPKDKKASYFNILAVTFLCALGFIIYSNTLHSPFQFDDESNITNNFSIWNIYNPSAIFNFLPTRFITNFSLALNYRLNGPDVFGYHLFNTMVHILAAIMVWWLVLLTLRTPLLRDTKISGHSKIIALFAGLIFISHPIQTQAITYIIQRAASLATLFYVSSLVFYVKSRLSRQFSYYILSIVTLILAMFSKEMTLTLPLMILLYEFCFFGKEGIDWKRITPFIAALFIIPATMVMTKCVDLGQMRLAREVGPGISPWNYLLTQSRVFITYIRLLFVPINQNLDYDYVISKTLFDIPVLSSLILLVIILISAIKIFRKYRLISFGIFWFFLALLPESSIIPIKDVIFEHRLYLPMVGYAIFLVSAVYYIFENKGIKPAIAVLSIAIISYSMLTYNRNFIWKDGLTLWDDAAHKSPNKARPYNNRGNAYQAKGNLDQAISDYNKAIEINPKYDKLYYNRGVVYQNKGNLDQAISDYNKAIEINPAYGKLYYNLGNAYQAKGSLDQAISDYNKAIEINPKDADAYINRGNAYQAKGNLGQAISDYNKAIEINPKDADAYINRAVAYFKNKDYANSWRDVHSAQALGREVGPALIEELEKVKM